MPDTIIIQRVLPHYRLPIFRSLYKEFGWELVVASNSPSETFLNLRDDKEDFIHRVPYDFPDHRQQYRCDVPLIDIVDVLKPRRIISEFSLQMNIWHQLPKLRAARKIDSYALWSHGWNMERGFGSAYDVGAQLARLLAFIPADLLLTYTGEGKAWVERWLPWKEVVSIGNTLDVASIASSTSQILGERRGTPQLLAVGRLTPDKKMHELLTAYRIICRTFPAAKLTIIGDGPERSNLEQQIEQLGIEGATLVGALYDESDLAAHFKGADLLLIPGAAGLSVNHALAYNLPVIAFGRGKGLPNHHPEIEYVVPGVTGVLCVEPGPEALADSVVRTVVSGEVDRLRRSIPVFVDRHLRIEKMIKSFRTVDALL